MECPFDLPPLRSARSKTLQESGSLAVDSSHRNLRCHSEPMTDPWNLARTDATLADLGLLSSTVRNIAPTSPLWQLPAVHWSPDAAARGSLLALHTLSQVRSQGALPPCSRSFGNAPSLEGEAAREAAREAAGESLGERAFLEALQADDPVEAACKLVRRLILGHSSSGGASETRQLQFVLQVLEKVQAPVRIGSKEDMRLKQLEPAELEMDAQTREYLAGFELVRPKKRRTLRQVAKAVLFAHRLSRLLSSIGASSRLGARPMSQVFFDDDVSEDLVTALSHVASIQAFDVFHVSELSAQQPLLHVGITIMSHRGLLRVFHVKNSKLVSFISEIEALYLDNPYHNKLHAAEVVQTTHAFLYQASCSWSELEVMSALLAGMCHDVGHPGFTNGYRVMIGDDDALTYNDKSVNENMHSAISQRVLQKEGCNFLSSVSREQFTAIRKLMIDIILATDMAHHMKKLNKYRTAVEESGRDPSKWDSPSLALEWMTHVADISSVAKPMTIAELWTDRLLHEFFNQGDREREQGLPVSPMCDRNTVSRAGSQVGFVNFIVRPALQALGETCNVSESMNNLEAYNDVYTKRQAAEKEEQARARKVSHLFKTAP